MKSKTIVAMAVAGLFWSAGSIANQGMMHSGFPTNADETTPSMSTINSLDNRTGGYKGWGPMANPYTASGADETGNQLAQIDEEREHKQQLAEVQSHRDQVWVANAPLRSEYENVGATRSEGGGFGRFFGR